MALTLLPLLSFSQAMTVQKIVNGKPCDTCEIKHYLFGSNVLPYLFIGTGTTPNRLYREYDEFKKSIPHENYEQEAFLIVDSTLNIVFLTEDDTSARYSPIIEFDKKYDYKKIEIKIEKNKKELKGWQILDKLKPVEGYKVNRIVYDSEKYQDVISNWKSTHQTGNIYFNYNDIVTITFRDSNSKAILRKLVIKRHKDIPAHFYYFQTKINTSNVKEVIQNFLNAKLKKEDFMNGDSTTQFNLKEGSLGILLFNSLEEGEEVEYSLSGTNDWRTIQKTYNAITNSSFILLDDQDIPAGKTQTVYLRYKGQPETVHKIVVQGISTITHTSFFKILAGFMLALLVFGVWYFIKQRKHKKQVIALNQKNKDIETRLSLLSGQLNPHFLFNSLHAIQGTINSNNSDEANLYIGSVAGFMRNVMDYSKKELISLQEEISLETDYLQLEQKRKHFDFVVDIDKNLVADQIDFPPLLLQPVLENSVRHAFGKRENPVLKINVSASQQNLIIILKDNGTGWNINERKEGHGLGLVRNRIELLNEKITQSHINMNITSNPHSGTTTIFTFENWLA